MKFLVFFVLLAATANGAPSHSIVSPVILPKVHLSSPDVTVVKQPYVIHQAEPVYRQVYYAADPLPVPYVSHHVVHGYPQHTAAIYHQQPTSYLPAAAAVNYVV